MQGNDIMVSVIVLTYNHERYIRQALDSILMQKVDFKYEILVGDDASTDGTPAILREYRDRFPDIFRLTLRETNEGASGNVYALLCTARGKYLATCEGDDYWCDENKLQCQVSYLEEHPQMIGCVHPCRIVDENGNLRRRQKLDWVHEKPVFTLQDFQGLYLPGQLVTFVRRNIFQNPQHDPALLYHAHPMVADRSSMVFYLLHGDIARIDRAMSCYRKVEGKTAKNLSSICFANNRKRVEEEYHILKQTEQYLKTCLGKDIRYERRRNELFAEAVFQWLRRRGDLAVAAGIFRESEKKLGCVLFVPLHGLRKVVRKTGELLFADSVSS